MKKKSEIRDRVVGKIKAGAMLFAAPAGRKWGSVCEQLRSLCRNSGGRRPSSSFDRAAMLLSLFSSLSFLFYSVRKLDRCQSFYPFSDGHFLQQKEKFFCKRGSYWFDFTDINWKYIIFLLQLYIWTYFVLSV